MASMRVLIAPQEFKSTLTAREASQAIARGLRRALPDAELDLLPVADGGPGTVEALVDGTGGRFFDAQVPDPLGRPVTARWGAAGAGAGQGGAPVSGTGVIEMAAASGLSLLRDDELNPETASTRGTGELVRAVLAAGYRRIIVGAGGSATNDGGAGLAQALGARLLDGEGRELPPGGGPLARLARIDVSALDTRLRESAIVVAADVRNPLCGATGASLMYGAQKGADEPTARRLDAALAHYAEIVRRDLGIDIANVPGAGAAGGLAAGLIAFCGATVRSGFEVVAEAAGLQQRLAGAAAVVTGEGRLDRQTGFGKTTAGVAEMARKAGTRVVAVVGSVAGDEAVNAFDAVFAIVPRLASLEEAMARAAGLVEDRAEEAGRWLGQQA